MVYDHLFSPALCVLKFKNGHRLTLKSLFTNHPPENFLVSNERYGQNKTFLLQCYDIDFSPFKRYRPFWFWWWYLRRLRFSLCDLSVYMSVLLSTGISVCWSFCVCFFFFLYFIFSVFLSFFFPLFSPFFLSLFFFSFCPFVFCFFLIFVFLSVFLSHCLLVCMSFSFLLVCPFPVCLLSIIFLIVKNCETLTDSSGQQLFYFSE